MTRVTLYESAGFLFYAFRDVFVGASVNLHKLQLPTLRRNACAFVDDTRRIFE